MQSTLSMKDTDPHDIFAIEPSFAPARSDNTAPALAPAGTASQDHREPHFGPSFVAASPAPPVAPTPSVAPATPVAPVYRATVADDARLSDIQLDRTPRPTSRWAIRAFWFMFAIVSAMGAAAWQHYGDRAKQMVAEWTPNVALLSSLIPGKPAPAPEQTSAPAVQTAATEQPAGASSPQDVASTAPAAPVAAPAAAAAPAVPAAPVVAATAPDQAQLLQSMAHDLASMGQQIEQLKASIDQLKAGQDQLAQRVAKITEARAVEPRPVAPRPRVTTLPPHAAVVPPPVRRPAQTYVPPPPGSAAPLPAATPQTMAPAQPQQPAVVDADDDTPVVRPPMPVR
jgi:hypothetical protein